MKRTLVLWFFFIALTHTAAGAEGMIGDGGTASGKPTAAIAAGRYDSSVSVTLQTENGGAIYYTLDGSNPSAKSSLYTKPITLKKTTVIRAIAVETGKEASRPMTSVYVIGADYGLPVVSLVTDPDNLDNPATGLFQHPWERGQEWERPAAISMIRRNGELLFHFDENIGVRIHGGASRMHQKKSFRIYWRDKQKLEYPLFSSKQSLGSFKRLILRSGGNDFPAGFDGNNHWTYTIREHVDKYYLRDNCGVDPENVDLISVRHPAIYVAEEGNLKAWQETLAFFRDADLSRPDQYKKALDLIDVENFTDYQIMQIYGGNWDWPQNNDRFYRERVPGAKWHWVMWDADHAFNLNCPVTHNTLTWATRDRAIPSLAPTWQLGPGDDILNTTLILRKLLGNAEYRKFFIKRTDELLNTVLQPDHVVELIENRANLIRPCVDLEESRWGPSNGSWERNVKDMISFARRRPDILRRHYRKFFRPEDFAETRME